MCPLTSIWSIVDRGDMAVVVSTSISMFSASPTAFWVVGGVSSQYFGTVNGILYDSSAGAVLVENVPVKFVIDQHFVLYYQACCTGSFSRTTERARHLHYCRIAGQQVRSWDTTRGWHFVKSRRPFVEAEKAQACVCSGQISRSNFKTRKNPK